MELKFTAHFNLITADYSKYLLPLTGFRFTLFTQYILKLCTFLQKTEKMCITVDEPQRWLGPFSHTQIKGRSKRTRLKSISIKKLLRKKRLKHKNYTAGEPEGRKNYLKDLAFLTNKLKAVFM